MPFETNRDLGLILFRKLSKHYYRWILFVFSLFLSSLANSQAPVPEFSGDVVSGCSPLVVRFTDQSSGNPTSWNWDLGNGQLSTLQNPVATYNTPGLYTITLVARNANGINSITKTNYIVVNPSPTANFTSDNTIACMPAVIQFQDLSVPNAGSITNWLWDFGDGSTSTLQNPVKTYSSNGFYTVSLRVTSSSGCQSTTVRGNYIRVVSGVTADFSSTLPTTCRPPFLINFTNLTSGPGTLTYQWDFGNSTNSTNQNPSTTYAAAGTYTVRLIATSQYGCNNTIQRDIVINGAGTSITSPDTVCLNTVVNFQNTSSITPVSTVWDFGNGRGSNRFNDTSSFTSPGTYLIKIVNTYADCVDSAFKNLVVLPDPSVDFTAPTVTSCKAPFTVNFQDLSTGAVSWNWDFGDGGISTQQNPSHIYSSTGQFDVRLRITNSNGCTNTVTKSSFVRIVRPTVRVTNAPNGGCAPFNYSPIADVTAIDGIASYFWDFGDGFTSTSPNPSHSYALGNYTLKLVITTIGGCTDSIVYTNGIRVGSPSNNGFTASPLDVCAGDSISFVANPTTIADQWSWNFGDGGSSSLRDPRYAYLDTGFFSVTLTAINNGCPTPFTRNLYVHIRPGVARFGYTTSCTNKLSVAFSDSSLTDPSYGPISYLWEFGDPGNSTSTAINPTFIYPSLGTYTVRLTVNNGSCSNTLTRTISLSGDIAEFTISKTTVCKSEIINFNAINSNPATVIIYLWSFDNGFPINSGPSASISFQDTGLHTVTLMITDQNGCRDTMEKINVIRVNGPIARFGANVNGGCLNTNIRFTDSSTSTSAPLVRWTYDFGDGQTQVFNSPPFSHTYTDTGSFTVRLTVEDATGCPDTYTYPVNIRITDTKAKFGATNSIICPGIPINFLDSSSGRGLTYTWTFGDGSGSNLRNPTHTYLGNDSVYSVKLVVADTLGCTDSTTKLNFISVRSPKPAFSIADTSTICPPLETKFTFQGRDYESFYWDFGDGATSTRMNPNHFYNSYGTFTPKLYLIGYGGCIDSASARAIVYNPSVDASLNYSPTNACNSLLVDFSITTPPNIRFTFFSGDGVIDSSQRKSFQYEYKSFGFFFPQIILKDTFGCQVGVSNPNIIRILGAEPLFGVDDKAFCDSATVLFANYTIFNDPVVSSLWNFGDGGTSNVSDPSHFYNTPGVYYPSLTVNTVSGCSKTLTDTIRVYSTPNVSIAADTIICINELAFLRGVLAQADTAITWRWTFGNGSGASSPNTTTTYTISGTFPVTLETTNLIGCKDTATLNIFVPSAPVVTMGNNPVTIPINATLPIPVTYSNNIATYAWAPVLGLSCTDCPVPTAGPKSTTTYKVTATDIYGCTATNEFTIVVVCNEKNYFLPNTFSPNNDGNNDIFYPRGNGVARVQSMRIFNRWGEMVFERRNFIANDPSLGWNGTSKGKKAEMDTYVYIVEFVCENSVIIPFKGNVTLIR